MENAPKESCQFCLANLKGELSVRERLDHSSSIHLFNFLLKNLGIKHPKESNELLKISISELCTKCGELYESLWINYEELKAVELKTQQTIIKIREAICNPAITSHNNEQTNVGSHQFYFLREHVICQGMNLESEVAKEDFVSIKEELEHPIVKEEVEDEEENSYDEVVEDPYGDSCIFPFSAAEEYDNNIISEGEQDHNDPLSISENDMEIYSEEEDFLAIQPQKKSKSLQSKLIKGRPTKVNTTKLQKQTPGKRGRGRPKKITTTNTTFDEVTIKKPKVPKKRGRPRKMEDKEESRATSVGSRDLRKVARVNYLAFSDPQKRGESSNDNDNENSSQEEGSSSDSESDSRSSDTAGHQDTDKRKKDPLVVSKFCCKYCNEIFFKTHEICSHYSEMHEDKQPFACYKCNEKFSQREELLNHIPSAHSSEMGKRLNCSFCGRRYESKSYLKSHIRQHGRRFKEKCPFCSKEFEGNWAAGLLRTHVLNHHENKAKEKNLSCHLCSKKYATQICLDYHVKMHEKSKSKPFMCPHCDISWSTQAKLDIHISKSHSEKEKLVCQTCGKTFVTAGGLKQHETSIHRHEKNFECTKCTETFYTNGARQIHFIRVHGKPEDKFSCKICQKLFVTKHCLTVHMRVHTGEKKYACNRCDEKFRNSGALRSHGIEAHGDAPFECEVCKREFKSHVGLHHHKKNHTDEPTPFICSICSKGFRRAFSLREHLIRHKNEKAFICEKCGKSFKLENSLKNHTIRMHSGIKKEKKFACTYCPKKFEAFSGMQGHVRQVHTFEKPYVCDICEKSFSKQPSLRNHKISHYKIRRKAGRRFNNPDNPYLPRTDPANNSSTNSSDVTNQTSPEIQQHQQQHSSTVPNNFMPPSSSLAPPPPLPSQVSHPSDYQLQSGHSVFFGNNPLAIYHHQF